MIVAPSTSRSTWLISSSSRNARADRRQFEGSDLLEHAHELRDSRLDIRLALDGRRPARVAQHPGRVQFGGQPGKANRAADRQVLYALGHARVLAQVRRAIEM